MERDSVRSPLLKRSGDHTTGTVQRQSRWEIVGGEGHRPFAGGRDLKKERIAGTNAKNLGARDSGSDRRLGRQDFANNGCSIRRRGIGRIGGGSRCLSHQHAWEQAREKSKTCEREGGGTHGVFIPVNPLPDKKLIAGKLNHLLGKRNLHDAPVNPMLRGLRTGCSTAW